MGAHSTKDGGRRPLCHPGNPPAVETDLTARYDGSKIGPDKVATALLNALRTGRTEVRPGQSKALYAMSRIAPGFIFRALNSQAEKAPLDQ